MTLPTPHWTLYSRTSEGDERRVGYDGIAAVRWHFSLRSADGDVQFEAADEEPEEDRERLELLAVVRGLESLDGRSRVTLVTSSPYVRRGFRFGLAEWKKHSWQWERYGRMAPVKHADLWRRVDRIMEFHEVECRELRFDPPQDDLSPPHFARTRRTRRVHAGAGRRATVASGASGGANRPGIMSRVQGLLGWRAPAACCWIARTYGELTARLRRLFSRESAGSHFRRSRCENTLQGNC